MQSRQAATSLQSAIALRHALLPNPGQMPVSQPIAESGSLSTVVAQDPSGPPHAEAIFAARRPLAFARTADVFSSLMHAVPAGSRPLSTFSSHLRKAPRRVVANLAVSLRIVALHFTTSAHAADAAAKLTARTKNETASCGMANPW
jgi:hypothetical protein